MIALLYIGQTPREDITGEVRAALPAETELREFGMLDGLHARELSALTPQGEEPRLITRLRDGSSAAVAEARLFPLAAEAVLRAEDVGAELCVLMCTGAFPPLAHRKPLLYADDVIHKNTVLPANAALGVILPDPKQFALAREWWADKCAVLETAAASPYGDPEAIIKAALDLKKRGAGLLCLDCMGFTAAQREAVRQATDLPVLLPRLSVAEAIQKEITAKV